MIVCHSTLVHILVGLWSASKNGRDGPKLRTGQVSPMGIFLYLQAWIQATDLVLQARLWPRRSAMKNQAGARPIEMPVLGVINSCKLLRTVLWAAHSQNMIVLRPFETVEQMLHGTSPRSFLSVTFKNRSVCACIETFERWNAGTLRAPCNLIRC